MKRVLSDSIRLLCTTEKAVSASMLVGMVLLNMVEIIRRMILHASLVWVQEITSLMLIWFAFAGFAYITYAKKDIYITYFMERLPEKARKITKIILTIFVLFFLGMFIKTGILLMISQTGVKSMTARFPENLRTLALVVSMGNVFLVFAEDLINTLYFGKKEVG